MTAPLDLDAMAARSQAAAALADAATAGPWVRNKHRGDIDIVRQADWTPCDDPSHDDCYICQTFHPGLHSVAIVQASHPDRAVVTAAFIAASRTAVPELAADVLALIAEVRRLREGAALISDIADYLKVRHELEYMDMQAAWKPLEARIVAFAQGDK